MFVALLISNSLIACALISYPPERVTPLTVIPSMPQTSLPASTKVLVESKIAERLISSKWQGAISQDSNLAPEVTTWEFYSNGMFRRQFTSDFSEERMGAWFIPSPSEENNVIFLANTTNVPPKFDVLSLRFENGQSILGEFTYEETPFTGTETPPTAIEKDLQAVTTQRDGFFSFWTAITANDWQSVSAPSPGDADMYSFIQDGTYAAHFNSTQCQYVGTWSISSLGEDSTLIWLSIPANNCDPRGGQDRFVREIPIRLEGDNLILFETIYAPMPKNR